MVSQVGWHAHVQVFMDFGLKESLLDVQLPETPIVGRRDGEYDTYRDKLDHGGKNGLKIHAKLLGIAICDQTRLEFLY